MEETADPTMKLAAFAANFPEDQIPPKLLKLLPVYILDAMAAMLAGCTQPVFQSALSAVSRFYESGTCSSIVGTSVPLSGAILLDGIAAGNFEFEHVIRNAHPASTIFPALLVLASVNHCSGKDFVAAMAVGYELATRIGAASTSAVESMQGFHNPGLNGCLAAAGACCRLLGCDQETTASAIGIAASSAAGLMAFANTGAMTKQLHPARAGQLGAEAALMAQAGIVGPKNVLENPKGFLNAFSPAPKPDLLTVDLGTTWTSAAMILKLSPVHAYAQTFVYAINAFRDANGTWNASDVGEVTVNTGISMLQSSHLDPTPSSLVAAQYSIPFCIAAALATDLRDPLAMNNGLIKDQTVLAISSAIKFNAVTNSPQELGGTLAITIHTKDVIIHADKYPGSPGNPEYIAAAEMKYYKVVKALRIEHLGGLLKDQISAVREMEDIGELRQSLIEAGKGAVENCLTHSS